MSKQIYGYSYGSGGTTASTGAVRSFSRSSLSGDESGMYSTPYGQMVADRIALRYADSYGSSGDPTIFGLYGSPNVKGQPAVGSRRSVEALYHQSILGNPSTISPSEALYSMGKRPRIESGLPIYPQRPGEKDCNYYMITGTCKFGDACKFDHPLWVPEGGIPDWKEVPRAVEILPERPGEPDCAYYMKTKKCKYGPQCKFNHPKEILDLPDTEVGTLGGGALGGVPTLPERPSEPICAFYAKTGNCKFGANCKFHHPRDLHPTIIDSAANTADDVDGIQGVTTGSQVPAMFHNSKGLPIRPGESDCSFYLMTGSCKYGAICRYNHPDRHAINPPLAAASVDPTIVPTVSPIPLGVLGAVANLAPSYVYQQDYASLGVAPVTYPQRPGETECDYYMKHGTCKFGERCKFHHPIDRHGSRSDVTGGVKLTLAGLPRREGELVCAYYMKTGTCKYGVGCKFDHPPPGEAVAMATSQGVSVTVTEES